MFALGPPRRPTVARNTDASATRREQQPGPGHQAAPHRGSGPSLKKNLYVASPVAPFDKLPELLKQYQAAYPGDPTLGVVFGTAAADVMRQILDKACEDGDLTPEGVSKAKDELGTVDTGGLAVPLTFKTGESPSDASYIFRARTSPGGAKAVSDKFVGDDVAAFVNGG